MEILETQDEIRSEDVRDFLEQIPSWIIRWGIIIITVIILSVFTLSWFIKYPTIVSSDFTLSSSDLPTPIIPKINGRIERLFYHENERVENGDVIAFLESTADHEKVLELEKLLNHSYLSSYIPQVKLDSIYHLGELQEKFKEFQQVNNQIQLLLSNGFFSRERNSLESDIISLQKMNEIVEKQLGLYDRDAELSEKEFEINKKLYKNKVIAELDLYREESKNISKEIPVQSLKISLLNNISLINQKNREILNLENELLQLESSFTQSLNSLQSAIQLWKEKYLLMAPVSGRIYTSGILQEQQALKLGEEAFYIVPSVDFSIGQVRIPQENFGKVKIGQEVLIKFEAFPFQEFGIVKGVVSSISPLPNTDNSFFAIVDLPKGLTTNTGKKLHFRLGMSATAEIVTEDTKLLERFIYNFKKKL